MNLKQKLYDLQNSLREQSDIIGKCLGENDCTSETYTKAFAECEKLKGLIEATKAQIAREEALGQQAQQKSTAQSGILCQSGVCKGLKMESIKAFAAGVRKTMTEGTQASGGYTVPDDVVNRIYELIEAKDNMLSYITNTPVTTDTGARTYKTRATMAGFATAAEAAKIAALAEPTFAQIRYTIVKRAGYLPVTNELLADSDENITALVMQWIADEARVTINKNVVATLTKTSPTAITGLDGILNALVVTLGSAFRARSTIHTNDSGLMWLLTLKDSTGRSLLQPYPNHPEQMTLCVGPLVVPIKVWDNSTIPNTGASSNVINFFVGDTKEGIERFARKEVTVTQLKEATVGNINLAEQDMVAFRAIMRDDYQVRDEKAWVHLTYTPTTASAAG